MPDSPHYDLYRELGLSRSQSCSDIAQQLEQRLQEARNAGLSQGSAEVDKLTVSLRVLGNSSRRQIYDAAIANPHGEPVTIRRIREIAATSAPADTGTAAAPGGIAASPSQPVSSGRHAARPAADAPAAGGSPVSDSDPTEVLTPTKGPAQHAAASAPQHTQPPASPQSSVPQASARESARPTAQPAPPARPAAQPAAQAAPQQTAAPASQQAAKALRSATNAVSAQPLSQALRKRFGIILSIHTGLMLLFAFMPWTRMSLHLSEVRLTLGSLNCFGFLKLPLVESALHHSSGVSSLMKDLGQLDNYSSEIKDIYQQFRLILLILPTVIGLLLAAISVGAAVALFIARPAFSKAAFFTGVGVVSVNLFWAFINAVSGGLPLLQLTSMPLAASEDIRRSDIASVLSFFQLRSSYGVYLALLLGIVTLALLMGTYFFSVRGVRPLRVMAVAPNGAVSPVATSQNIPQHTSQNGSQGAPQHTPQNESQSAPQHTPQNGSQSAPQNGQPQGSGAADAGDASRWF